MIKVVGIKEYTNGKGEKRHIIHVIDDTAAEGLVGSRVSSFPETKNMNINGIRVGSVITLKWNKGDNGYYVSSIELVTY